MITSKVLNLPDEVLLNGKFCVTRKGEKQPYDPFLNRLISAKDTFYDFLKIYEVLDQYDSLGIKVGNGISAIDIDDCVNNGVINDVAMDIIRKAQTYTEVSPSGTGIRILFKSKNPFDRNAYKIKNSQNGIEYYDGDDQERYGARMVRLSGSKIFDYNFREVDTTEILNKYMVREVYEVIHNEEYSFNEDFVNILSRVIAQDNEAKTFNRRSFVGRSESDWDLVFLLIIAQYTNNKQEIEAIFRDSKYFKTKSDWHKKKWLPTSRYGERTMRIVEREVSKEVFNRDLIINKDSVADPIMIYWIAVELGFTKAYYFRNHNIPKVKISDQDRLNQLYHLSKIRQVRKYLLGELEGLKK